MPLDHWMLFGTFAQQDYFEYPDVGTYQGVIINANMAAHAPAGLAAFLLEKTAKSSYIIDPLTHAFQHDPEVLLSKKGEPKSSIMALAEEYGEPFISRAGKGPLSPTDLSGNAVVEALVERCVDFQCNQMTGYMKVSKAAKYLDESEVIVSPYAVIAPYFYMTETTWREWLRVNEEAARCTRALVGKDMRVFGSIVISKAVLVSKKVIDYIVETYMSLPLDGALIWIDDLEELAASKEELVSLLYLARSLRNGGKREAINLHGGYFSVLAGGPVGGHALSGVSHGPEYGEAREIVPVGGGIPIARFYIPDLHARIKYRDAVRMFTARHWLGSAEAFYANVCRCEACRETIGEDPANFTAYGESVVKTVNRRHGLTRIDFPTKEARDRCLKHYLQRKKREFDAAAGAEGDVLMEDLRKGFEKYKGIAGLEGVAHLKVWKEIFETKAN